MKDKNQISEKRGFCQSVAKYEKQANILTRTSAKSSSVLKKKNKKEEKEKKETKKKQQQNLTFLSELYERKKDSESNNGVLCSCGTFYIGRTHQQLGERLYEHKISIDKSLRFENKNDTLIQL